MIRPDVGTTHSDHMREPDRRHAAVTLDSGRDTPTDDSVAPPGSEMGLHPQILARVRRLALVSSVALGAIFVLGSTTLDVSAVTTASLAGGWVLMPTSLVLSIKRPRIRYLLILPSTLVSAGLLAICLTALPVEWPARVGWLLITGGVMLGGILGLWFWYRFVPVPRFLDAPFSPGRWALIGIHVAMIVLGLTLVVGAEYVW